jgi:hypothetical protein
VFALLYTFLLQTLGVTVQLLKLALFAQLAAAFGASSSMSPLWQVVPLLVLIVLYWLYVRFFVPMASLVDTISEVIGNAPTPFGCALISTLLAVVSVTAAEQARQPPGLDRLGRSHSPACQCHLSLSRHALPVFCAAVRLQVIGCACDLGTFVCCIIVAVMPATKYTTM